MPARVRLAHGAGPGPHQQGLIHASCCWGPPPCHKVLAHCHRVTQLPVCLVLWQDQASTLLTTSSTARKPGRLAGRRPLLVPTFEGKTVRQREQTKKEYLFA